MVLLTAGIGMFLGYLIFLWAQAKGWYENYGLKPEANQDVKIAGMGKNIFPYVATILLVPIAWLLIKQNDIVDFMLAIVGGGVILYLLFVVAPKYETKTNREFGL
ncbi:MAG: hypothetical protein R2769_10215 [Saprospiraceae bacterium]